MDFAYLAKVTKLNVAALACDRQRPAAAGTEGRGGGEHGYDGELDPGRPAPSAIVVRWRPNRLRTNWQHQPLAADSVHELHPPSAKSCKGMRVDDWVFGVSSVSADG